MKSNSMTTGQMFLIIFSLCTTAAVIVLAIIFAQTSKDKNDEAHQKNVCSVNLGQAQIDLLLARKDVDELQTNALRINCGDGTSDVVNNTCQAGMVLVAKTLGDELGLKVTLVQQGTSVGTSTGSYGATPHVFVVATTTSGKLHNIKAVSGVTALKKITHNQAREPIISFKIENTDGSTNLHHDSDPHVIEFVNAFNNRVPMHIEKQDVTKEGYTQPKHPGPSPAAPSTKPHPAACCGSVGAACNVGVRNACNPGLVCNSHDGTNRKGGQGTCGHPAPHPAAPSTKPHPAPHHSSVGASCTIGGANVCGNNLVCKAPPGVAHQLGGQGMCSHATGFNPSPPGPIKAYDSAYNPAKTGNIMMTKPNTKEAYSCNLRPYSKRY